MVLSRKKLKKKYRSLLAESLAASESKDYRKDASSVTEVNHELQNVRELLVSKSRRPKLFKRGNRGKKRPLQEFSNNENGSWETREGNQENEGSVDTKKKCEGNKRKKKEDRGQELEEGIMEKQELERKNKDKQKKKKRREMKLKKTAKEAVERPEGKKNADEIGSMNDASKVPEVAVPVQVNESEVKKAYVGGIPYYSNEDDIRSFFENCGTVTEVDCMTFPETGKFRGIAILSFKTEGAAKRALALDGADMGGFFLKVQPYKVNRNSKSDFTPEIIDGYNRVYVGNLSWDITEDDLKQLFSECKILSVRFGMDKETGDFKGYAHVDFTDSISLAIALKLDQKVICGRPVRVRCAVPRKNAQTEPDTENYKNQPESITKLKKKRRTCYECGTPGHLSTECPQKRGGGGGGGDGGGVDE